MPNIADEDRSSQNEHTTRNPPVSKLNHDILWLIFLFNSHAKMEISVIENDEGWNYTEENEDVAALTVNRHTSQVCSQWRTSILSSPSVWANSIDLKFLNQKEDHWRNEVFLRTGDAPFTLVGRLGMEQKTQTTTFAFRILAQEMNRIRCISLYYQDSHASGRIRDAFQSPAPKLEQCSLFHSTLARALASLHPSRKRDRSMLFSDHSPRLKSFLYKGYFTFALKGAWLSGLTQLHLLHAPSLTLPNLLKGLAQMPLLEQLYFDNCLIEPGNTAFGADLDSLDRISLSRLIEIAFFGHPKAVKLILPRLGVSTGCSLRIRYSSYSSYGVDMEDFTVVCTTFLKKYSAINHTEHLNVVLSSAHQDILISFDGNNRKIFQFSDRFDDLPIDQRAHLLCSIAKSLTHFNLSNVTKLNLGLSDTDTTEPFVTSDSDISKLFDFFVALGSVQELWVDSEVLVLLVEMQESSNEVLFRHLSIVHYCLNPYSGDIESDNRHGLSRFLLHRLSAHVPIRILELATLTRTENTPLWLLEEIEYLIVE